MQKLLVADDSPTILRAVELALKGHDYEVKKALNGQEAFSLAREWRPDVILADTNMPEGDGFSLSLNLKNLRELKNTYVILLHSSSENMTQEKLKSCLADDSLMKPFNVSSLIEVLPKKAHEEDSPSPQVLSPQGRGWHYSDIEKVALEVIERIGWEVVPRLSEKIIREELNKILKKPTASK
ncbi:MAG: hypothetical protein A3J72_07630 [Nitrospirae bacterium RIFCSPHIGHO2_02_FULL_40_19]|nr:MAG: hypothetical protein A3J72_07630 [Nitrospirae bacterium RIFCSPHIGHO2_02_FULL_40_19]